MADRIVVMRDGVVEQIGAPLELYDRPATLFVAGFIGSPTMNLLKGSIRVNGKPSFVTETGVELPLKSAPSGATERPCVYGIRPEHLTLAEGDFRAEISVVEPTGSRNSGLRQARRPADRGRLSRTDLGAAGRQPPLVAEPRGGPSVRRGNRKAAGVEAAGGHVGGSRPSPIGELVERKNVFERRVALDVVRAGHDVSAILSQIPDEPPRGFPHVRRASLGKQVDDIHAAMEAEPRAEITLQARGLHPGGAGLNRVQDVDAHLDEIGDERPNRSVGMVHQPACRAAWRRR